MDIEKIIEAIQEGESSVSTERLIYDRMENIISYLTLVEYKESSRSRKAAVAETLKNVLLDKHLCKRFCTPRYLFILIETKKNSKAKKISDSVVELIYSIYSDSIKALIEYYPEETLQIITDKNNPCYLDMILRCIDSSQIVNAFLCFFSLPTKHFQKWVHFLITKEFIDMVFKQIQKYKKTGKELQSFFKILYLFVSFTTNIFKKELHSCTNISYTYFYNEIETRISYLLDMIFLESDAINRASALEVLREMIKITGYINTNNTIPFTSLFQYLKQSQALKDLQNMHRNAKSQIRVINMVNIVARTIRFQSAALQDFFTCTNFIPSLIRYLYSCSTFSFSNELCGVLNELIHVNRIFYQPALIEIAKEVRSIGFQRLIETFADSKRKHSPNVSILDRVTPFIYILYQLYISCLFESRRQSLRQYSSRNTSQRRFIVVEQNKEPCPLLDSLSFFSESSSYWYRTVRLPEYQKRLSLDYIREMPAHIDNLEQFSRYICDYVASSLPVYPHFLF